MRRRPISTLPAFSSPLMAHLLRRSQPQQHLLSALQLSRPLQHNHGAQLPLLSPGLHSRTL
eukprot:2103067-Prorocentrum_lima.AAC.1